MQLLNFLIPAALALSVAAAPNKLVRKDAGEFWKTNEGSWCHECVEYSGSWAAVWENEEMSGKCACVAAENKCVDLGIVGFNDMTSSFKFPKYGPGCALFASKDCTGESYGTDLWENRATRWMTDGWNDKPNSVICYTD